MRRFWVALLILITLPIAALLGIVEWSEIQVMRFSRSTPLAAGLHGEWNEVRRQFRRRVEHQFPIGTKVDDLVRTLTDQNFQPTTLLAGYVGLQDSGRTLLNSLGPNTKMAVHDPGGFACTIDWIIGWQSSRGAVTRVLADVHAVCL